MNKTIRLRGPTRPVINVTTRKDGDENQAFTNIIYDRNLMSFFLKQLFTKSKRNHITTIIKNCTSLEKNIGLFLNAT